MQAEYPIYLDYYSTPNTRKTCHAVKQDLDPKTQQQAIETIASTFIASHILDDIKNPICLIPAPQPQKTNTKKLAETIANKTNTYLLDIVKRKPDEPLYVQKQNDNQIKKPTFYLTGKYPKNATLIFIDNMISSGQTYRAINDLFDQDLLPLVYAIDYTTLKDEKILQLIETIKNKNQI